MKCEYNNSCYETAKDGYYIEYDWNVEDNLEAEFEVWYDIDGSEIVINVCEGCKGDIEDSCEREDNYEWSGERRIRPQTEGYKGRRSVKYHYHIQNTAWTEKERMAWMNKWHKNNKKHLGKRCTEACWN